MIGFKLDQAKSMFFDRQPVMDATEKAERQRLSKFGAFVRTTAKQSIKTDDDPSAPGQPPHSHTGLLKKFIFFGFDPVWRSVVIGPIRLNKAGALHELEEGGEAIITTGPRRRRTARKVRIRARPFMAPAFATELKKMDPLWRDAIK